MKVSKYCPTRQLWDDQKACSLRVKCALISSENPEECFLIGGKENGIRLDTIELFNSHSDKISQIPTKLPCPRSGCAAVRIGTKAYICGGNDGEKILDEALVFDLETYEIKKLKSMKVPRDELALTVGSDGSIYAIGGFGGNEHCCLKSVER
jgi:hypothetical protein